MIAAVRMDSMTYIAIGMVVVAVVLEAIDRRRSQIVSAASIWAR